MSTIGLGAMWEVRQNSQDFGRATKVAVIVSDLLRTSDKLYLEGGEG
jgi:hypothetical protein